MVWNDTRLDSALEQLTRAGLRFGTMALDGERVELLYAVTRNLAPFDDVDEPLLILRLERDELVTIQPSHPYDVRAVRISSARGFGGRRMLLIRQSGSTSDDMRITSGVRALATGGERLLDEQEDVGFAGRSPALH